MILCNADARRRPSTRPCSPACRAARTTTPRRRIAVALQRSGAARLQAPTRSRSWPTPRRWPTTLMRPRLPPGLRRHRQPPDPDRPHQQERHRARSAAKALDKAGIELQLQLGARTTRASRSIRPAIRLGTPSVTTRGMGEEDMEQIAAWMDEAVSRRAQGRRGRHRADRGRGPRPAGRRSRCPAGCPPRNEPVPLNGRSRALAPHRLPGPGRG